MDKGPIAEGVRISIDEIRWNCAEILKALGAPGEEAHIVADGLARAEARGQQSHGLIRLPTYVRRVRAGLIRVPIQFTVESETIATLTVDAGAGFGHVATTRAMSACITKARTTGVALAAIRNSTHFGIAGLYAELAAKQNMIGIVTSNGAARMTAHGGKSAVLGTNPIAVAIPTSMGYSVLLDMATSVAALGKVLEAQAGNATIPAGWALDADGRATTDPNAALAGVLLPMAGPKGYGLALVLEVISAVLSGAAFGTNVGSMYRTWDRSEDLGHLVGAISIEAFTSSDRFLDDMATLIDQIRQSGDEVFLPGEMEHIREEEADSRGIKLGAAAAQALVEATELVGARITSE